MVIQHSPRRSLWLLAGLALLFGGAVSAKAQFRISPVKSIGDKITCHVGGSSYSLTPNKRLIFETSFTANYVETQDVFNRVSSFTELRSNVYTVPVMEDINVEICPGNVNFIAYNADWLKALFRETRNNAWALYAIIAHEIGHYVLAHDRTAVGSDPAIELEADEYAGEILAKMGALLSDAQAAFSSRILQDQRGESHPPIAQRLAAVKKGWDRFGKTYLPPQEDPPQADLSQVDISQMRLTLTIGISGQLNTIHIAPAANSATRGSFSISGQNTTQSFYLEYGTAAQVVLSGQMNKIYVAPELSNRVRVIQSGQLNEVIIK